MDSYLEACQNTDIQMTQKEKLAILEGEVRELDSRKLQELEKRVADLEKEVRSQPPNVGINISLDLQTVKKALAEADFHPLDPTFVPKIEGVKNGR
ncbi:MAG: hypothetical protein NC399_02895 [Muribaculum sp.]|nr:hypothetical protein [Muribaculum sp.]